MTKSRLFSWELQRMILLRKKELPLVLEQIYNLGVKSLPLVALTALATGMVMTLQFGTGLNRFGGILYVPRLVTVSVLREMGPVFASLMLAARIGAGVTAELGAMKVTQQFDAYWALGSSPIIKVIIPRVLAIFISLPLLCAFANIVSLIGVYLIALLSLNIDSTLIWSKVFEGFSLENFSSGFFKSFFFAGFISFFSCYYGMNAKGGSEEVGKATTRSVVTSSISILIGDFALTQFFLWL